MNGLWTALRVVCFVVGALVLYCVLVIALWVGVRRLVRGRRPVGRPGDTSGRRLVLLPSGGARDVRERRGSSVDGLPDRLSGDRPWAVAAVLLGASDLRSRTGPFVDFAGRRIDWAGMLEAARGWPAKAQVLVSTAYDLVGEETPAAAADAAQPSGGSGAGGAEPARAMPTEPAEATAEAKTGAPSAAGVGVAAPPERAAADAAAEAAVADEAVAAAVATARAAQPSPAADGVERSAAPSGPSMPSVPHGLPGRRRVTLTDLVTLLDEDDLQRVYAAMDVRRGRRAPDEALALLGAGTSRS